MTERKNIWYDREYLTKHATPIDRPMISFTATMSNEEYEELLNVQLADRVLGHRYEAAE